MSLINDALKKAQRQRASDPPALAGGQGADEAHIARRRAPMRTQLLLVLAAAAAVLVVFSVVITVYWLNRDTAPARPPAAVAPKTVTAPSATATGGPSPIVVAPLAPLVTPAPASSPAVAASAAPKPSSPEAAVATPAKPAAGSASPTVSPASRPPAVSTPPSAPPLPAGPDPRIQVFVDGIRVTGIRSSGSESKVLLNDRVYRVNDVVERTFGLKLVKVEPDQLTFVDPNGNTYTKNF